MSSDESDIEIKSALHKKTKMKMPKSPSTELLRNNDPQKVSAKVMIHKALTDLRKNHSRKGVSIQAIKKYMHDNYCYDVERNNYIIKKYLKNAVEKGTILQTKGIGASGSFRLANIKEKIEKKKKKDKIVEKPNLIEEKREKLIKPKKPVPKDMTSKTKSKTTKKAIVTIKEDEIPQIKTNKHVEEKMKKDTKKLKDKTDGTRKNETKKSKTLKKTKDQKTPAKKRTAQLMKRKSVGSIIKPPKMKPNSKK